jgi:hypothetical protein
MTSLQIGDRSYTRRLTPVSVAGLPSSAVPVAIAAGNVRRAPAIISDRVQECCASAVAVCFDFEEHNCLLGLRNRLVFVFISSC